MKKGDTMSKEKNPLLEIKERVDALKIEVDYNLDEMIKVKDYRSEHTFTYETQDGKMTRCDISEENVYRYALSLGVKSIEGEKVTDDNLDELILKHCGGVAGMIVLYYRMTELALKKK